MPRESSPGRFLSFENGPEISYNRCVLAIEEILEHKLEARKREVDELLALGWGDTPPERIPANWREVRGPGERRWSAEHRAKWLRSRWPASQERA
jgi:hypothetical protein